MTKSKYQSDLNFNFSKSEFILILHLLKDFKDYTGVVSKALTNHYTP